jgi:hypothetical protein
MIQLPYFSALWYVWYRYRTVPDVVTPAGIQDRGGQVGPEIVSDDHLDVLLGQVLVDVHQEHLKQAGTTLFTPLLISLYVPYYRDDIIHPYRKKFYSINTQ